MTITVVNTETGESLACKWTKSCYVFYAWSFTPKFLSIMPPIVYKGVPVISYINGASAPAYYKGTGQVLDLRIDGTSLKYNDTPIGNT